MQINILGLYPKVKFGNNKDLFKDLRSQTSDFERKTEDYFYHYKSEAKDLHKILDEYAESQNGQPLKKCTSEQNLVELIKLIATGQKNDLIRCMRINNKIIKNCNKLLGEDAKPKANIP